MTKKNKPSKLTSMWVQRIGNVIASRSKERRVCIIAYHRILERRDPLLWSEPDIDTFAWQMETLAANFNVISLYDAVTSIQKNVVPPRAVCITFDDGYRSTHDLALPVLKRLDLPATVFVTTGCLDNGQMWNDRIVEAVRRLPEGVLDLQNLGIGKFVVSGIPDRKDVIRRLNDHCLYLSSNGRLEVIEALEVLVAEAPGSGLMLTGDMVARLSNQGIEIGAHTVSHPILTKLEDADAQYEICESKRVLEGITGHPVRLFAYPNGKVGVDFDQRHVQMVEDAGYKAAFTTAFGAATPGDDLFNLPRSRPWDASPLMFSVRLLSWLANRGEKTETPNDGYRALSEEKSHNVNAVLLIAFHFPPQAESSGIQRTLSFSKNLRAEHWAPSVISAAPFAYERTSESQLSQLPKDVTVKRTWALDAKKHIGYRGRYPEIVALPDRWVTWWFSAVSIGLPMLLKKKTQVIWTTYPIATAHLIGLTLKFLTGHPWVADFRDPMTQDNYPESKRQRRVFRWIEKHTIHRCDAAVFTTHSARDTYVQRYSQVDKGKFHVIENGYDEDGFGGVENSESVSAQDRRITLLHSGLLYSEGRDPSAFFAAIALLKQRGVLCGENFRVILRAPGDDSYFRSLVLQQKIDDVVSIEPPVTYQEALREMIGADGLLVFQGTPFNTQIPAKIYEYFRARRPIFGLLDLQGETARVLEKAGFNNVADMGCSNAICVALDLFIAQIRSGQVHVATEELIAASSRKYRARQLANLFDQVTQRAGQ